LLATARTAAARGPANDESPAPVARRVGPKARSRCDSTLGRGAAARGRPCEAWLRHDKAARKKLAAALRRPRSLALIPSGSRPRGTHSRGPPPPRPSPSSWLSSAWTGRERNVERQGRTYFSSPVMAEPCFAWTRGRKDAAKRSVMAKPCSAWTARQVGVNGHPASWRSHASVSARQVGEIAAKGLAPLPRLAQALELF
jgi:hypothetical protein